MYTYGFEDQHAALATGFALISMIGLFQYCCKQASSLLTRPSLLLVTLERQPQGTWHLVSLQNPLLCKTQTR